MVYHGICRHSQKSIIKRSSTFNFNPFSKTWTKLVPIRFFWFNVYFTFWDLVTFTYLIPTYLPSVKIIWPDIYTVSLFAQPASFHTELKDIQSRTKTTQSQYSKVSIIRPARYRLLEFEKKSTGGLIETFSKYPDQVI